MKWFCVLLLMANAGFVGWKMSKRLDQMPPVTQQTEPASAVPSLVLLRELAEPPRLRRDNPVRETAADGTDPANAGAEEQGIDESVSILNPNPMLPSADICITAGPLTDAAQKARLREWLAARSVRIVDETRAVRTRQLYGVFLEALDAADAERQVADLETKGVADTQVIRRGGLANTISLGLFATQEAVNERLGEMQRQGYRPVVVPQYETRREFWLRAELGAGYETTSQVPTEMGIEVTLARSRCAGIR